ncbi:hypothetical protein BUZ61_19800, partial [Staphylococcus nepalensis]
IYTERTAPWLERMGFDVVKEYVLNPENQDALYERIMEAKRAVEQEPWSEIVNDREDQKIFEVEKV